MELLEYPHLAEVLREFADYFRNDYEQRLIGHDRYATGELLESIRTEVRAGGTTYEVVVHLRDYWKYIEDDTRPHFPPPDALLRWVQVKPTLPRPFILNGKEVGPKSLAYLIGMKISRVGTKGTHDLADAKKTTMDTFKARVRAALGHDLRDWIRKV